MKSNRVQVTEIDAREPLIHTKEVQLTREMTNQSRIDHNLSDKQLEVQQKPDPLLEELTLVIAKRRASALRESTKKQSEEYKTRLIEDDLVREIHSRNTSVRNSVEVQRGRERSGSNASQHKRRVSFFDEEAAKADAMSVIPSQDEIFEASAPNIE